MTLSNNDLDHDCHDVNILSQQRCAYKDEHTVRCSSNNCVKLPLSNPLSPPQRDEKIVQMDGWATHNTMLGKKWNTEQCLYSVTDIVEEEVKAIIWH